MRNLVCAAGALLLASTTPVLAAAAPADPGVPDPAMMAGPVEEDDEDFPWGLLGLLGLAGLLGLKRDDRRDDTIRRP